MIFKFFDEDANGTLDPREIGKLNATIFYTFPRFGYMGAELPGKPQTKFIKVYYLNVTW